MMRSAARRNEVANYRLEMIVSGSGSSGGSSSGTGGTSGSSASNGGSYQGDARVPGTDFHATGNVPCAMSQNEPTGTCPFGVVREGNGSGKDQCLEMGAALSYYGLFSLFPIVLVITSVVGLLRFELQSPLELME